MSVQAPSHLRPCKKLNSISNLEVIAKLILITDSIVKIVLWGKTSLELVAWILEEQINVMDFRMSFISGLSS